MGPRTEPTRKHFENTDFTLAHSMNLGRRSEASMRSDAVATQPDLRNVVACGLLRAGSDVTDIAFEPV